MFPQNQAEFFECGTAFRAHIEAIKKTVQVADFGWYPYGSLSALPLVSELLAEDFAEITQLMASQPVADLGCGDGELAMFLSDLGADVDAIDHAPCNFNQMRGIKLLQKHIQSRISVHDVNLDECFELPRPQYGFTFFLGTLYHLKNPFYTLEKLAQRSAYCLLSTRIAQRTAKTGVKIKAEPLAYLLEAREANDDPTNFWIFSETGLNRILNRAGWLVRSTRTVGCLEDSNPVESAADERMFVLARSRFRFPELHLRLLKGFHAIERESWRWTAKEFGIEVTLPPTCKFTNFALKLFVPDFLARESSPVKVHCSSEGEQAGTLTLDSPGLIEFRGIFSPRMLQKAAVPLEFEVESSYVAPGDRRELGILIPLLDASQTATARLPFRIS